MVVNALHQVATGINEEKNAVVKVVPNLMEGGVVHIPYMDAHLSGDLCLPKIVDAHHWFAADVAKEATVQVRVVLDLMEGEVGHDPDVAVCLSSN